MEPAIDDMQASGRFRCPGCGARHARFRPGRIQLNCMRCHNTFVRPDLDAP